METPTLNRRLVLEETQNIPDGAGGFQKTWVPLGTLWANVRPGTGREKSAESATVTTVPYKVTVRAAPYGSPSRPKADQRFREGQRIFRITAVSDNDDRGRYLTCNVEEERAA